MEIIVGMLSSLKLSGGKNDGEYKEKVGVALKELEFHRRELENTKIRLGERRKSLFDSMTRALQEKNRPKASIFAAEHAEVKKTMKAVEASELALIQITLRLQSIMEVADAMAHMTSASRTLQAVSQTMEGFVPALGATSESINNTLAETMSKLGQISPTIQVDIKNENAEELVAQARMFADEQAQKLKRSMEVMPSALDEDISQVDDRVPILATGDDYEEESPVLGTIFSSRVDPHVETQVLKYAKDHNGVIDVSETSNSLGIPMDEVELSMLHLVAQEKVKSGSESSR